MTIATGEKLDRTLGGQELFDGDAVDELVNLTPAFPGAGVHTPRPGETALSMSVAVT